MIRSGRTRCGCGMGVEMSESGCHRHRSRGGHGFPNIGNLPRLLSIITHHLTHTYIRMLHLSLFLVTTKKATLRSLKLIQTKLHLWPHPSNGPPQFLGASYATGHDNVYMFVFLFHSRSYLQNCIPRHHILKPVNYNCQATAPTIHTLQTLSDLPFRTYFKQNSKVWPPHVK